MLISKAVLTWSGRIGELGALATSHVHGVASVLRVRSVDECKTASWTEISSYVGSVNLAGVMTAMLRNAGGRYFGYLVGEMATRLPPHISAGLRASQNVFQGGNISEPDDHRDQLYTAFFSRSRYNQIKGDA